MQKEVEIYKDLADIQGKYIPKLVCYGYYGGGMSFVIGLTIVGTMLSDQKIKKRQRSRAIKGLEAIHKHGILHNDIREENVLINDNGDVYLIDFAENVRRDVEIAEIKAEVVKLAEGAQARDDNEESKQLTSRQSEVISKEMISGYDQDTIEGGCE
ncbi:10099_t:CDS:2 [Funneliformis geosporum]|uniref:10099_t:CDS:1 n=1 Tax=Funneliformis geosporum TaxID=1117311 RepID=A0A9W4WRF3_9GLOM|nr:10099_t:CDS:2 [Funneliformis geosporum]